MLQSPANDEVAQAAKDAGLRELDDGISFSDRIGGEDAAHFMGEEAPSFLNKNELSGIVENKDDKLTQSQLLKRMLEAEERDNKMDKMRETEAAERDR